MNAPRGAVFLSYASQDAEAARRICDALRSGGVEVWFDADGGLEHGDEWDAKIRRQIKECVLFIPVISANTEARHEGYFRIEWDLAAERARGIASGVPFILPVVIDDTREPEALVPDRFRSVQWTRLRGGEVPPDVKARFLKLWSHRTGVLKQEQLEAGRPRPAERDEGVASPARPKAGRRVPAAAWIAPAFVVAAGAYFWLKSPTGSAPIPAQNTDPGPRPPALSSSNGPTATATAPSEADQDLQKARELIYDPDSGRTEFFLAEKLLKRATELAPLSGSAWGASALLNQYLFARGYDMNRERLVRSQADGENALRLDPRSVDALLALGLRRLSVGENAQAKDYLDRAHAADPQNVRVIIAQARQLPDRAASGQMLLDMAGRVPRPAELFYYAGDQFTYLGRFDDAAAALEHAIAAQPFWRTLVYRAAVEGMRSADPVKMIGWLDRVPEIRRDEPRVAVMRHYAAMLQRDAGTAARVISDLAVDYLEDNLFVGPKAFLIAQAQELAGHPELATEQWQTAERIVREKMAADPAEIQWRSMLAVILAGERRTAEGRTVADACAADARLRQASNHQNGGIANSATAEYVADAYARLGDPVRAIEVLRNSPYRSEWGGVSAALLAVEPRWASLHGQPGYAELVEEMKSAENQKPGGSSTTATRPTPDAKSVAVLAFENLSADKGNEYFSDGIAEELLTTLQKIPGLRVAARTSAWSFKGRNPTAQEVGEKLGMANVVEGSVEKSGNRVKIFARLSRAATNEELWSRSFGPLELTDVFATQSEIAQAIVGELRGRLAGTDAGADQAEVRAQVRAAEKGGTRNPAAHELYLQGRFLANQGSRESTARAEGCFRRAVELDPSFALGWAALAITPLFQGNYGLRDRTLGDVVAEARQNAKKALGLEPDLADGHLALSLVQSGYDMDWKGAAVSARRALDLAPSDAEVLGNASRMSNVFGDLDRAYELALQAVALDPLNMGARYALMSAYWDRGDFARAETEMRHMIELNPTVFSLNQLLGLLVVLQGRADEAAKIFERETEDLARNTGLAFARWAQKRVPEADAALQATIEHGGGTVAFQIAEIYGFRGERDAAFMWLERARQQHDFGLCYTRVDHFLDSLHGDPRWPAFVQKIGLADEQLK